MRFVYNLQTLSKNLTALVPEICRPGTNKAPETGLHMEPTC